MTEMDVSEVEAVDLAVVAYDDDGTWHVQDLPEKALVSVETIARELRRYPGDRGAIALLSVDEDFIVIVRAHGPHVRALLSDVTVAADWVLAASVMGLLGLPIPDDEEEQAPAGDMSILADLGVSPQAMGVLFDDYDLYPDEVLSAIARKAGFGRAFDDHVGLVDE